MPPQDARSQRLQPPKAETGELNNTQKQGKLSRSGKPSANSKAAGAHNMSSNNSNQQDQRTSQKTGEKDFPSPNQMVEGPSNSSHTRKNASVANTSATGSDECEDEEFPPQVRNSKHIASGQEYTKSDVDESPGFVRRWFSLGRSNTPSTDLEQRPHAKRSRKPSLAGQSPKQLKATSGTGKQISKGETAQAAESTQTFNQAMKQKEAEWQAKEMKLEEQLGRMQSQNQRLENGIQQIQGELEHRTRILEAKVQEAKSEKEKVEAEYSLFLRQKQEEKFKEMDSWLPVEGSKLIGDLDRLKRDMRSFGKGMATNDSSVFQRLDEADHVALLNGLAEVCVLTNGGLPEELTSPRSPALLLNALLAHHVYTTFFKNPFFFLGNGLGDALPQSGLDSLLNEIYSRTQQANQEEAHIWRSQTLRLLLPQLRDDATSQEKELHRWTSELISNVANLQAAHFLEGPARHLIHDGAKTNPGSKLQSIYQMAANISYMMWTRRATLKCCTLRHLHQPTFDPESKDLIPHSSVKFDQFEDQLEGRPITLIVHPLLQLYGTNDAKNYDQGSVWAPAEVWLDSRKPTQ